LFTSGFWRQSGQLAADQGSSFTEIVGLLEWNEMMLSLVIVMAFLVLVLLARYTGLGRDWWPRNPFSH
jgi:hypothetical protein